MEKINNKKRIILSITITIAIIILVILSIVLLNNNRYTDTVRTSIVLIVKENLEYEINSELYIKDIINTYENIELTNGEEIVDTSKLGKNDVIIKYKNLTNNQEEEKEVEINIIDTTKPSIEIISKEITITEGDDINLIENAKVTDNSKEEITAEVSGEFDNNKAGKYKIKYKAKDSSNNEAESDEVTIIVEKKKEKETYTSDKNTTSSSNTNKTNNSNSSSSSKNSSNSNNKNNSSSNSSKSDNSDQYYDDDFWKDPDTPKPTNWSTYSSEPNDGWGYSRAKYYYIMTNVHSSFEVNPETGKEELVDFSYDWMVWTYPGMTSYDLLENNESGVRKVLGAPPSDSEIQKLVKQCNNDKNKLEELSNKKFKERTVYYYCD